MRYTRPIPYKDALNASHVKTLLPTSMSSADAEQLVATLGAEGAAILERGRFSARVQSAQHLDVLDSGINDVLAGGIDIATARLRTKQFLRSTGYVPDQETRGTLQDFSSDARINLQLTTNVQMAQGYGFWKQGQDPDLLDAFPAQEFVRVEARRVPRTDWPQRWNAARSATTADGATDANSGRMVALKNHPIWVELSRFKLPYEPFDYNSGMGTEDVGRREAMRLGLIGLNTQIFPQDRGFNDGLKVSPEIRSERVRTLLEQSGVGRFDGDGVFHFTGGSN